MKLLHEYALDCHDAYRRYFNTCVLCWILFLFALSLFFATYLAALIWPSAALGGSLAFLLLLWGAWHLPAARPQTRWGRALQASESRWFPPFLFLTSHFLGAAFFLLLWDTLIRLGWPSNTFINVIFFVLLGLVPIKRLIHSWDLATDSEWARTANSFGRHLIVSLATLMAAAMLSLIVPDLLPTARQVNPTNVAIWILAILTVILNILLFISQLPRHRAASTRPPAPRPPRRPDEPGKKKTPVEY